jgi:hypothetical protein
MYRIVRVEERGKFIATDYEPSDDKSLLEQIVIELNEKAEEAGIMMRWAILEEDDAISSDHR